MKYAFVLAGALLAAAHPHQNEAHGRLHRQNKRAIVTEVDVDVVTLTEYVTVGAPSPTPAVESPAVQEQAAVPSAPAGYIASEASSDAAPVPSAEASSDAMPASTPAWSPSAAPAPSAEASSDSEPASTPAWSSSVAPSSSSTSPPAYSSTAPSSSSGISKGNLTPNGKKRGLSGYVGIQNTNAFKEYAPYLSWYSDYTPSPPDAEGLLGVGMLWGAQGSPCGDVVTERLATFTDMANNDTTPSIMFGFYEPDCTCTMSSDMSTSDAATQWDGLIAPLASKGTVLGSPSMCKQKDEDFLTPFKSAINTDWDVTSVHINKPNVDEAKKVVDYYVQKYGKPVWVSEFACVNDQPGWSPCTDQTQIDSFINDCVQYFEGEDNVVAYGPSNGEGLGTAWPLTDSSTGELTTTGKTYLNAIKSL